MLGWIGQSIASALLCLQQGKRVKKKVAVVGSGRDQEGWPEVPQATGGPSGGNGGDKEVGRGCVVWSSSVGDPIEAHIYILDSLSHVGRYRVLQAVLAAPC